MIKKLAHCSRLFLHFDGCLYLDVKGKIMISTDFYKGAGMVEKVNTGICRLYFYPWNFSRRYRGIIFSSSSFCYDVFMDLSS